MRGQASVCPPLLLLQEIDHDYMHLILMDSPCSEPQGEQPKRRGKATQDPCQNAKMPWGRNCFLGLNLQMILDLCLCAKNKSIALISIPFMPPNSGGILSKVNFHTKFSFQMLRKLTLYKIPLKWSYTKNLKFIKYSWKT